MKKEKEESNYQPHYGIAVIGIILIVVTFCVVWYLVMDISEYSIEGVIDEVKYMDNGFASDSVKVFFRDQDIGAFSVSLTINFDSSTYYDFYNSSSKLDYTYQLLKRYEGDYVVIEYTKSPIGDIGFKSLELIEKED